MAHPLQVRIDRVRRQARRLVWCYGLGWLLAALVSAVVVLGLLDYLIRFEDPGLRVLCTLSVACAAAAGVWRFLYRPLARRWRDVEMARRVERRFPALGDQLSTAVEFLAQSEDDPEAGSALLRRWVVSATTAQADALDFSAALDRRPTRRALRAAGGCAALAAALLLAAPQSALLAVARLANPLGAAAWPRHNNLELRDLPARLAAGQSFEVVAFDRFDKPLPTDARLLIRYPDGAEGNEESEPLQAQGQELVGRKPNVGRPFEYRVVGGDDRSMPWRALEVIEPPRVESLQVKVHPPAYTGWPAETADRTVRALRGSRVEFTATTTKKVVAVTVRREHGPALQARVERDGFGFHLPADLAEPLRVDKSERYWFALRDEQEVVGGEGEKWEIQALADEPPSVVVEQPAANLFLTPEAIVPLRVLAKDDLAVRDVALVYQRSDRSDVPQAARLLWSGPEKVAPTPPGQARPRSDQRSVEDAWELAPLGLKPGEQVSFYLAARDYLPQEGRSTVRRLSIITRRELDDRLAQRQALIMAELARVLKLQQDARTQVKSLEIQLREVGALSRADIDHAQGAELNQRQVSRTLTSRAEGVPAQITDLLAELSSNQVDSPDLQRRMENMLTQLDDLAGGQLEPIERQLTAAIKGAQLQLPAAGQPPPKTADPAVRAAVDQAGVHQDEVIRVLEAMVGDLAQWDSFRRFARDVAQLRREQEELLNETRQTGLKTLTKAWRDLDAQQQADLKKLAQRQLELARRLDKTEQQMDQSRRRLAESDPLASATLGDALDLARRLGISGQMRQTGGQLEENRVGQAAERQEQAAAQLAELADLLANRREQELSRLVKRLREAESQLAELRKEQQGLQKRAAAAREQDAAERQRELERLAKEERELKEETERLARRLERLQAEQASRSLARAGGRMQQAGQAGEQGDGDGAGEQAAAAQKDLDEAQRQLAERRRQAEADLAREQLARLEDGLKSLHQRQQGLLDEAMRLEGLKTSQGQLTRGQSASLGDLARQQQALSVDTSAQREKLSEAEVFGWALRQAASEMDRAAALLEQRETAQPTHSAQRQALAHLERVLTALKPGEKQPQPGEPPPGGQPGQQPGQKSPPRDAIRSLAELKLLKLMQEDLNRRFAETTSAEARLPAEELSRQLAELSDQQGRLAEFALRLSAPAAAEDEADQAEPGAKPADGPPLEPEEPSR